MTSDGYEPLIGLMGAAHADTAWVTATLDQMQRHGVRRVLQTGDLGYQGGAAFIDDVNAALERLGMTLGFVSAGCDNRDLLAACHVDAAGHGMVRPRIRHLRDRCVFTLGSRKWRSGQSASAADPVDVVLSHQCLYTDLARAHPVMTIHSAGPVPCGCARAVELGERQWNLLGQDTLRVRAH